MFHEDFEKKSIEKQHFKINFKLYIYFKAPQRTRLDEFIRVHNIIINSKNNFMVSEQKILGQYIRYIFNI